MRNSGLYEVERLAPFLFGDGWQFDFDTSGRMDFRADYSNLSVEAQFVFSGGELNVETHCARGIAAHRGRAAVGVEKVPFEIGARPVFQHHQTVGSQAVVSVAPRLHQFTPFSAGEFALPN